MDEWIEAEATMGSMRGPAILNEVTLSTFGVGTISES